MLSPLYLLMTLRLSTKSFHRRTVIDLAARLGPHKPPRVLAVESVIWDAVFRLAEGRLLVYAVLSDLAKSLPWSDIDIASNCNADKRFFVPGLRTCLSLLFESRLFISNICNTHSYSICSRHVFSATEKSIPT